MAINQFRFDEPTGSNFFGDAKYPRNTMGPRRGLTLQAQNMFRNRGLGMQLEYTEQLIKLESLRDNRKMREIQYETAVLNLNNAKEEARRKREAATSLLGIQEEYNSVLNNENLTGRQRRAEIGKLGVKFANAIAVDPAARNLHNSAAGSITLDPAEPSSKLTLGDYIRGGNSFDLISDKLPEGITSQDTIPPEVYSEGVRKSKIVYDQERRQLDAQKKQEQNLNSLMSGVAKIEYTPQELRDPNKPATGSNLKTAEKLSGGSVAQIDKVIELMPPLEQAELKGASLQKRLEAAQRFAAGYNLPPSLSSSSGDNMNTLWGTGP